MDSPIIPLPTPRDRIDLSAFGADDQVLAAILRALLERSGLTQAELQRRMGLGRSSIHQYRHGLRRNPSLKWLVRYVLTCGGRLYLEMPREPL